ncbi:hypothetical protein BGZ51_008208 [Haplosporangium sp. Z 767]|nr:hypothetical protein BGZ50_007609 [Haplosporangium sp. Z 11]KAF9190806.1 hypothetical protein BGZ51_008208 [Haplosporangium sp. Z 767]
MSTTFPQTEINLEALENVRTRLFQLQESILFFLRSINPETTPGTVSWTELHSKFNVLIAKYLHLTNILNDPHSTLLQSYTVFPNESPANDQQVQNLSVLLRTKLFPELQQEVEDRTRDGNVPGLTTSSTTSTTGSGAGGGGANTSGPIGGTPEERRILAALKLKVTMHDALCQAADEIFENQRDMVHTKVRYESDDEDEADNTNAKQQQVDGNGNTLATGTRIGKTDGNHRHMTNDILQVDDFAIGTSSPGNSGVRYMDDWGGVLNGVGGSSSMEEDANEDMDGDGLEELDDKYFEMRRQEAAAAEQEESGEESSENEIEDDSEMASVFQADAPQSVEEQGKDDEHEDDFMEVSAQNQAMETTRSDIAETMMEDTFGGESDSSEEDMEEVM